MSARLSQASGAMLRSLADTGAVDAMSDKVVVLDTPARRVERSVVDMLCDLLIMAQKGEIVAMASAAVYADGHTGSFASENQCAAKMIGATAILVQELAANAIGCGHMVIGRPSPEGDPAA